MSDVLGYDSKGNKIYEYRVLHDPGLNNQETLNNQDPRFYCALVANDGNAYAISVYDWWTQDLIRKRENIPKNEEVSLVLKPIWEMENYEVSLRNEEEFYYDLDRKELKRRMHIVLSIIKQDNPKMLIKK